MAARAAMHRRAAPGRGVRPRAARLVRPLSERGRRRASVAHGPQVACAPYTTQGTTFDATGPPREALVLRSGMTRISTGPIGAYEIVPLRTRAFTTIEPSMARRSLKLNA